MRITRLLPGLAFLCLGAIAARGFSAVLGVNHLLVSTMGMGLETPEQHIETIQRWKAAVDESSIMTE